MDRSNENSVICICNENENDILDCLSSNVEIVYSFRDRYFENHSVEDAINKNEELEALMNEALTLFNKHEKTALDLDKAKYSYLRGRLLNVLPKFSPESEVLLSRACKLNPKLMEAWNELGESYWKKDDLVEAKNCFKRVAEYDPNKNKVALRNLSMLVRQEVTSNAEERKQSVEKGLAYAKEAVQVDPQDGVSWSILGNAHLCSFFAIHQNPKTLKLCLSAYLQAEKDVLAKSRPELHYNKGITHRYEEEYLLALESFKNASLFDPTWESPKIKQEQLLKYLNEVVDLVTTHGKMKAKRLQQLLQSIDSKLLGPYNGGSYTSSHGQTVKLVETSLKDLNPGINEEKVVLGKVVCSIRNEDTVPFTFCLVDKQGTCVVVSIFNLSSGKGVIIGDSVAIPEPFVVDNNFTYNNKEYKFRLIRVETPLILVINGRKANRDLQAGVQMSLFKKYD
ncbi:tetratricopeptide repeat protein 5 [Aethina tumida]|uniref:tetratricopeptide repeat protein 5 n=1 Tax=Aethina tumida TaxID=116153 RepID=UPI00096B2C90|nr:tetratricopeptide repeat protein 5 [Aethina tumida]